MKALNRTFHLLRAAALEQGWSFNQRTWHIEVYILSHHERIQYVGDGNLSSCAVPVATGTELPFRNLSRGTLISERLTPRGGQSFNKMSAHPISQSIRFCEQIVVCSAPVSVL